MPVAAIGAGVSALGNIAGGIAGNEAGRGDRGEARNAAILSQQILQQIQAAPDESKAQLWNQYRQAGVLTPQMEATITAQAPEISQFKDQADVVEAQRSALNTIGERAKGGLTAEDRYNLGKARQGAQSDIEAKREQILQNMAARGLSGSGSELAAQLSASQAGAQTESDERAKIMAQASKAALEAALAQGNLSSNIRGQEFQQALGKSEAQSQMERFNVGNQQSQQARNVGALNEAQRANLGVEQSVLDKNTTQSNEEIERQMKARRQKYLDDVELAKLKSGAYSGQAQQLKTSGDQAAQSAQGTISGIGGALSSVIGAMGSSTASSPTSNSAYLFDNKQKDKYGSIA